MYENEIYSSPETINRSAGNGENLFYAAQPAVAVEENRAQKSQKPTKEAGEPREKIGLLRKVVLCISLGLCFGLFAGVGFYVVQLGTSQFFQTYQGTVDTTRDVIDDVLDNVESQQQNNGPGTLTNVNQITYVEGDVSDVVDRVMPAMVSIVNTYTETTTFWGQTYSEPSQASGSGIIVARNDEELLIATNNHVVEDADKLEVTFIDGTEAEAVIKGLDPDMDLAVIAVPLNELSQETKDAITVAVLGDSDALKLGERVIAIGNALGYGQSVSGGWVSALNRQLDFDDGTSGIFIQTDAAINPGNSGGALLNLNGEVIGINSAKIGGSYVEGMGYAIPITAASPIIQELMNRETRTVKVEESERGYMGVELQNIREEDSQLFNMPRGAFVYSVVPGLAAEAAGIRYGDIIVGFDGQRISSRDELMNTIQYYRAGETVIITVQRLEGNRGYESYDLEITLGEKP